jgi:hypothetical protein
VELDIVTSLAMKHKRKRKEEENEDETLSQRKKAQHETLAFLKNNIGRNDDFESESHRSHLMDEVDEEDSDEEDSHVIAESDDEWEEMTEDVRRATFQAYYKKEKARLKALILGINGEEDHHNNMTIVSDDNGEHEDIMGVNWEDG